MNVRQILAASAASATALLLSSCAVDGYSYYGTGYTTGGAYCPPAYGSSHYYRNDYCPPVYSYSYNRPRYDSSYGSNYCPPVRPIVVVNDRHSHYSPGRPWNNHGGGSYGNSHGGNHHGGGNGHAGNSHGGGSWSGNSGGGHRGQSASYEAPRGNKADFSPRSENRSSLMSSRGAGRSSRLGRD